MPNRRITPEERAKRQLRALSAITRNTIKTLAKDPGDQRTANILKRYDRQVEQIVTPPREPLPPPRPNEYCWRCQKYHLLRDFQEPQPPLAVQWLWAVSVAAVFLIVFAVAEWWALGVLPVAWLLSQSFYWSITIPTLFLMLVILFLGFTGIRF